MGMSKPVRLKITTIKRLSKHAKPFADTPDDVINRILDKYEAALKRAKAKSKK